ncbi:uncharacterized protein [Physcomitrium patens]|uniref:uncharacterized protein n=1 Tax=Physcomitrium patens TaxID=3218 RepID=UPI003CCD87EB
MVILQYDTVTSGPGHETGGHPIIEFRAKFYPPTAHPSRKEFPQKRDKLGTLCSGFERESSWLAPHSNRHRHTTITDRRALKCSKKSWGMRVGENPSVNQVAWKIPTICSLTRMIRMQVVTSSEKM